MRSGCAEGKGVERILPKAVEDLDAEDVIRMLEVMSEGVFVKRRRLTAQLRRLARVGALDSPRRAARRVLLERPSSSSACCPTGAPSALTRTWPAKRTADEGGGGGGGVVEGLLLARNVLASLS
jgi:hypothetical protein